MAAVANAAAGARYGQQQYAQAPAPAPAAAQATRWDVPERVVDMRRTSDGVSTREYVRAHLLGKGGFARCYLFSDITKHRQVAGKVIATATLTKQRHVEKLHTEIRIHRALEHRHIVRFYSSFESGAFIYIMLELCTNQTLMELVKRRKRLSEPEARYWALQLLDATRYMHANGVIHRDLKLGNLFVNGDMELRVGDFGLATWLAKPGERRRTLCGTPNYIAPEILEQPTGGHSFEVDTWSIGVILYTLLVGRPPFETASVEETYARIRDCAFSFPPDCGVSAPARDLITWILQKNPAARPTLQQVRHRSVLEVSQHDFFCAPGAMVPRRLPDSALTATPAFSPEELFPGAAIVAAQLANPVAIATGLPAAVLAAKQRAAASAAATSAAAAGVGPAAGHARRPVAAPTTAPNHLQQQPARRAAAAQQQQTPSPPGGGGGGGGAPAATRRSMIASPPPGQQQQAPHHHLRRAASVSAGGASSQASAAPHADSQWLAHPAGAPESAASSRSPPAAAGGSGGGKARPRSAAPAAPAALQQRSAASLNAASNQQPQPLTAAPATKTLAAAPLPAPAVAAPASDSSVPQQQQGARAGHTTGAPLRSLFRATAAAAALPTVVGPPTTIAEALLRGGSGGQHSGGGRAFAAASDDKENARGGGGVAASAAAALKAAATIRPGPVVSSAAAAEEDANTGRYGGRRGGMGDEDEDSDAVADDSDAHAVEDADLDDARAAVSTGADSVDVEVSARLMRATRLGSGGGPAAASSPEKLPQSPAKQQPLPGHQPFASGQRYGSGAAAGAYLDPAACAADATSARPPPVLSPATARLLARRTQLPQRSGGGGAVDPPLSTASSGVYGGWSASLADVPEADHGAGGSGTGVAAAQHPTRPVLLAHAAPPPLIARHASGCYSSSVSSSSAASLSSFGGGGSAGPLDVGYCDGNTPREYPGGPVLGGGGSGGGQGAAAAAYGRAQAGGPGAQLRPSFSAASLTSSSSSSSLLLPPSLPSTCSSSGATVDPAVVTGGAGSASGRGSGVGFGFVREPPPAAGPAPLSSLLPPSSRTLAVRGGAGAIGQLQQRQLSPHAQPAMTDDENVRHIAPAATQQQPTMIPSAAPTPAGSPAVASGRGGERQLNDTYRVLCAALAAAPPASPLASPAGGAAMLVSPLARSTGAGAAFLPPLSSVFAWSEPPPPPQLFAAAAAAAAAQQHASSTAAASDGGVWVTTWLDYTAKYGLGYLLSNGDVGVYFNDSTKIILRAAAGSDRAVEYTERIPSSAPTAAAAPLRFSLESFPAELTKKVTLLKHFQGCLAEKWAGRRKAAAAAAAERASSSAPAALAASAGPPSAAHAAALAASFRAFAAMAAQQAAGTVAPAGGAAAHAAGCSDTAAAAAAASLASTASLAVSAAELCTPPTPVGGGAPQQQQQGPAVIVKKWVRTRRAVLFRLSNRTLQVAFIDGSALLLGGEGATATLLDHAGGRVCLRVPEALAYYAAAAAASHAPLPPTGSAAAVAPDRLVADVCRRLRYTRDVLQQLTAAAATAGAAAPFVSGSAAPSGKQML